MKAIRGQLELHDLPIIALTAKAMKSEKEKCLESGASDYITKPLNMEQLFSLMRVWLSK
ncbi:Response regulator MprA [compost metagenome]